MEDINKQITELQKKAIKYENMRGRYLELAAKLKKAANILNEVATEIDPYINVTAEPGSREKWDEVVAELYEKMQQGSEVTSELIQKTYNLNAQKSNYITQKLRKMMNVESRKIPGKHMIAYYCTKEFK